jgi:putative nucleotidyltransferase with HDIG domain
VIPPKANHPIRGALHWMKLARAHDPALYRHGIMVSRLSASFAAFLGCRSAEQHALARAGLLHDIGKIQIPAAILNQPFSLTTEQLSIVRPHSQCGYELLLEAGETDEILLTVVRDHHERLDGTGYPQNLTAGQISWPVRMVTLCDVFAAMTEPRPYADVMLWDEALDRMSTKRTRLDLDLLSEFAIMVKAMNATKKRSSSF